MINKNDDAFLKSIRGATPIKKNNKIKKDLPPQNINKKTNNKTIKQTQKEKQTNNSIVKKKSFYTIEKTPINKEPFFLASSNKPLEIIVLPQHFLSAI